MKKAYLSIAFLAVTTPCILGADGNITFYNRGYLLSNGEAADALTPQTGGIFTYRNGGMVGVGDGFTAGLFLNGSTTPLATTLFRSSSGSFPQVFAGTQEVTIPGVAVNGTANLVIRVWETGKTFATSTIRGEQGFTSQPLGGVNPTPGQPDVFAPGLTGFTGMLIGIPEPSTYALGIGGLAALTLIRRRA